MKSNWVRNFEKIVKPVVLVAVVIGLLFFGLSRESRAETFTEIGPLFASGEYSDGQALIIGERFDKYSIAVGYLTEQSINTRGQDGVFAMKPFSIEGMRNVNVYKKLNVGFGMAYFINTNRVLRYLPLLLPLLLLLLLLLLLPLLLLLLIVTGKPYIWIYCFIFLCPIRS